MARRARWVFAASFILLLLAAAYGFHAWRNRTESSRRDLLEYLPTDASAVIYVDLVQLRQSPFLKMLYNLAPQPSADAEYAQFVHDTGFDYEKDLDRVGIAIQKRGESQQFFAVADGRFDEKKIAAYALRTGKKERSGNHETYYVPLQGGSQSLSFAFVGNGRMVFTNDGSVAERIGAAAKGDGHAAWDARYERLAGSPVFALIRQDAAAGDAIAERAPGGWHSPQLASLLNELQWISIAAKPTGDHLLVVAEGESPADQTARQLSDLLSGALLLAEAGLNDPKMQGRMSEQSRKTLLSLFKSMEVERLDRGDTKSVRVVFEITPELLAGAGISRPEMTQKALAQEVSKKKGPAKAPHSKTNHTP